MSRVWLLAFVAAACGGPQFHRAGPGPLEIERVTLQWSNVYLLHRGGDAILVDSGSPGDRANLDRALTAQGFPAAKIKAVVVTHVHADHAGCAHWLQTQGAKVVIGAGDVATAARGTNDPLTPTGLMPALLATVFMFPFDAFTPDVAVDREIDLGAFGFPELRVVPVPGHTPGSLAVVAGDVAFVGDMIKGGEVFTQSPTEHLYQTDRAADHRALAGVIARGPKRLYLGHSGPLDAGDVTAWLAGADDTDHDRALSLDLGVRGETLANGSARSGATAGLRMRYVVGGDFGYMLGIDARAGYIGRGVFTLDGHPLGLALRTTSGAMISATAGLGIDGDRGGFVTHAVGELAGELPVGPVHVLARGSLGWVVIGTGYAASAHGIADEITGEVGLRLGRDRRWGNYLAGKGPYVAVVYRDLGGDQRIGVELGLDLFAATSPARSR
jgi:glyoxylase-like metal-dependent hydrolase (beta-lactamase superfamily II)